MRNGKRGIAFLLLVVMLLPFFKTQTFAASKKYTYKGMDYSDVYDYSYYRSNNPDLRKAFGNDQASYLKHFVEKGMSEGRVACADFNVNYYRIKYPDLGTVLGNDVKAYYIHYITSGKQEGRAGNAYAVYDGMDYSDVYDYADYRSMNPDLVDVFGNDKNLYIKHFVENGMQERRQGSTHFDVNCYIENYPDLQGVFGVDYKAYYIHYITSGKAEGRVGGWRLGDPNHGINWYERGGERYCTIEGEMAVGYRMINGRWYYFNQAGQLSSRTGIDVSTYNKNINWQAVKDDGIEFAMIRLGYGENLENQDDNQAVYNMQACEWLGIPYGVYLYSYALSEADVQSEIDHTLRMLGGRRPELGVYIDMEDADDYKKRHGVLKQNQTFQNICMQFVDTFQSMGYKSGIYASLNWMNDKLGNEKTASYPNWIAQWKGACEYQGNYEFWQTGCNGRVNGINGAVDMDVWIYRR